jgi:hypothetical protein
MSGTENGEAQDNGGHRFFITNGHRLRGKTGDELAPSFSLENALDACRMFFAMGQAFEKDGSDDVIRWERMDYFYQDSEILDLADRTSNYVEVVNSGLSINKARIKYPRLSVRETEGSNTLDEPNTEADVTVPLLNSTKNVNFKSNFRAAGIDIETSRRLASQDPSESFNTDDDIFIIASFPPFGVAVAFGGGTFSAAANSITVSLATWSILEHTITFEITGGNANDGIWTYDPLQATVTGFGATIFLNENVIANEVISAGDMNTIYDSSERNNSFNVINGVLDPSTVYNLRLTPLRCLMNNALWLNSALWYKGPTELYKTQFKSGNVLVESEFNLFALNVLGDVDRVLLKEADGVEKQFAQEGKTLFEPTIIRFDAEITRDELIDLIDACKGQGPNAYGYISTIDNDGNPVEGYLMSLSGLPNNNFYEIELLKRGDYY